MNLHQTLAITLDPSLILTAQGFTPDPWQREFLMCTAKRIMLNCSRGAGKSRVTSVKAAHRALFTPNSLTLLVSHTQRQAQELLRYTKQAFRALNWPIAPIKETESHIELANGSRIISLPGKEENIRSFQGVNLLIIDEAARVPDELYASVSPMTGTSKGDQVLLSTPHGNSGFFHNEWHDARANWTRFCIPWQRCPRLPPDFIEDERRMFGTSWIEQEYECSFESLADLVYADLSEKCGTDCLEPIHGKQYGGIDWGYANPFAAIWGFLDEHDVLWIQHERYLRQTALHEHADYLRKMARGVMWFADPSGPTEITEFRCADLTVRKGNNDIRCGIQAVTARIETGRLRIHTGNCPNLLAEARRYRREKGSEIPVDEHNHALGALRYLISRIDERFMARLRRRPSVESGIPETQTSEVSKTSEVLKVLISPRPWLSVYNEQLWEN